MSCESHIIGFHDSGIDEGGCLIEGAEHWLWVFCYSKNEDLYNVFFEFCPYCGESVTEIVEKLQALYDADYEKAIAEKNYRDRVRNEMNRKVKKSLKEYYTKHR
jgi:hypothetical protein